MQLWLLRFKLCLISCSPPHPRAVIMTFIVSLNQMIRSALISVCGVRGLDWSLLLHGCSSLFHSLGAQGTHPDVSIAFLSIKCCPCSTGGRVCVCVSVIVSTLKGLATVCVESPVSTTSTTTTVQWWAILLVLSNTPVRFTFLSTSVVSCSLVVPGSYGAAHGVWSEHSRWLLPSCGGHCLSVRWGSCEWVHQHAGVSG